MGGPLGMTPRVECAPLDEGSVPGAARLEAAVPDGWSGQGIRDALHSPGARCFVLREDDKVFAFAAFTFAAGEANLDALSVEKSARRRGFATRLLQDALDSLRGAGACTCYLEVRQSNLPAQALYESLGFIQIGIRRGFYTNPSEDAILYKKEL